MSTNVVAGEQLANVYGALAGTSAELASESPGKVETARHWRNARTWAQKSADLWSARRANSSLSKQDQDELDGVLLIVAKSDAALRSTP